MYEENERAINETVLNNMGLNPFALQLAIKAYKEIYWPRTLSLTVEIPDVGLDDEMHDRAKSKNLVQLEIRKPGFIGRYTTLSLGMMKPEDIACVKLLCQSYYINIRPYPMGFFYDGVEVQLHTPGVDESKLKNITRDIFNPTK